MGKRLLLPVLLLLLPVLCMAQRVQLVRGSVVDKESKAALVGVTVVVNGTTPQLGSVTDTLGRFEIAGVPVGKCSLSVTYAGYQGTTINDVLVTSAREVVLQVELEESA